MIFPVIDIEGLVQEGDKTRIVVSESYTAGTDVITKLEVQPGASESFYDVTDTGYLDWQFTKLTPADTEEFTITLRINDGDPSEVSKSATIDVISEDADKLFASDSDLRKHEPIIMNYLPEGRSSFKDVHRRTQEIILDWLSAQGYTNYLGNKITKAAFVDLEEVNKWATAKCLSLIFEGVKNAKDDVFKEKARTYDGQAEFYRNKIVLRIDQDGDGDAGDEETIDTRTCIVVRR